MKFSNFLILHVLSDDELLLLKNAKMINIDTKKNRLIMPMKDGSVYTRELSQELIEKIKNAN